MVCTGPMGWSFKICEAFWILVLQTKNSQMQVSYRNQQQAENLSVWRWTEQKSKRQISEWWVVFLSSFISSLHRMMQVPEAWKPTHRPHEDLYEKCDYHLNYLMHVYLLGKGGYVFSSTGLSVCLLVSNIIQKVINGLLLNFMEGSWVVKTKIG